MKMARSRLGIVYGLYLALRAKHPPTAMHSLRVALSCSKWAEARQMPEHQRDMLEVAALLHDLGKLGIPDRVLQKSSQLVGDEQALMELHVQVGLELLRARRCVQRDAQHYWQLSPVASHARFHRGRNRGTTAGSQDDRDRRCLRLDDQRASVPSRAQSRTRGR